LTSGRALSIEYRSIADLKPNPRSARRHPKRKIRRLADWIKQIGFTKPIVIDDCGTIVAGNALFAAAKELGMSNVPTVRLEGLNEQQLRGYALADNRLAEIADWDEPMLATELEYLLSVESIDFEIEMTGFEVPEVDMILTRVQGAAESEEPVPEPDLSGPALTQPGDLWLMGGHRLLCGNALDECSFDALMGRRRASAVFADPPWNVRIDGHATGNGAIHHREFAMASGEMSDFEFSCFLNRFQALLVRYSVGGSLHYLCVDWRHIDALIATGKQNYEELVNVAVWVKDNAGLGSFYRSQHELISVFRKGKETSRNNVQLGKFGRNRTNVWHYPGVQTQSRQGGEGNLLALHPTVKPVAMVADALLDCTARGEIVLDPFLGSGTTLMAAERVGRICCGIEIDPGYVDVAIRRWQNYSGEAAIHASSGKPFDEITAEKEVVRGR
jgi:DNA modification methylase